MQWRKSTDFKFQDRQVYFGRRTFANELGDKIVKGSGSYSDGAFWWKGLNEPPVMEKSFGELEILDESPPASAVEEAERMYPILTDERAPLTSAIRVAQQSAHQAAHIRCAGMYTDTIDKLKAECKAYESRIKELEQACELYRNSISKQNL